MSKVHLTFSTLQNVRKRTKAPSNHHIASVKGKVLELACLPTNKVE